VQPGEEAEKDGPRTSERVPPKISPFRWALWWVLLFFALILFYGLFAPFWFGCAWRPGRPSSGRVGSGRSSPARS